MFNVYSIIIIFLIYIRLVKAYSPGTRCFHASIRNDTKLYFFGGYKEDYSVGGDAFYLDLEESFSRTLPKWIEKSKANIELMHSSVCKSARDSFIFIGGTYRKSDHTPDKETPFIEYNHRYDIWSLPYAEEPFDWRINVQCVSDNEGSVYVFSGYTEFNKNDNIMYILNTIDMTWSTGPIENAPSYRHGYTSTMLSDGVIVYIGGCDDSGCMPMNLINVYDTKINKWSLISARGQDIGSREYHSAVLGPDDSIIIFGGYNYHENQDPYPHLAILNTTRISCEWSIPKVPNNADTPPLLYAHSATSIDKYMIVAFGSKLGHEKYNEELYIFDMESYSWVNKFAVPEPPSPPPPPPPTPPTPTPTSLPPERPPYFSVDSYYREFINLFIIRFVAISTLVIGHLYKTYK